MLLMEDIAIIILGMMTYSSGIIFTLKLNGQSTTLFHYCTSILDQLFFFLYLFWHKETYEMLDTLNSTI